jgi:hypothetical protein
MATFMNKKPDVAVLNIKQQFTAHVEKYIRSFNHRKCGN